MAGHAELLDLLLKRVEDYAVYLLDADGHVLTWNPGAERIKGYGEHEILGRHLSVFFPAEDRHKAAEALRTAAETGHFEAEAWRVRKDGTRFWGAVSLTALRDDAGDLKGYAKITRDLSERRRAEERLRATELKYDLLMAGMSEYAAFLLDPAGRVTDWGPAAERLLGYAEREILGRPLETFFPPDQRGPGGVPSNVLREAAKRGRTEEESWHVRKDGSLFWGGGITTALKDEHGGLKGYAKVLLDRTEKKRAEELRNLLAAIVESSDDAIVSKTLDGVITTWNKGAERVFGYAAEEAVGKPVTILFPPDRLDEEPAILGRLRRGERVDHYETVRVRKDGTPIDVSLTVSPVRDADGRIVGASKVARDVTDRKRAEATLGEETRVLELLNRAGSLIASRLELQDLLQAVTDVATELSGAQFGAFFYNGTTEAGEAYLLYTLSGAPREAFEGFGHPRATPLFGPTFRGEAPIRLDDVLEDPRYGRMEPHRGMPPGHLPVRSYLAVPVVGRSGTVIGGLFFGHAEPGVFAERTERLVVGVAAQAAVAVDNARLYADARRAAEERKQLLDAERAARAEAERASLMKDEFLATLSHELRTPLSAILGWAQLLQMGGYTPDDLAEGLETIARNAQAQSRLTDDLLDMNRIVSGKVRLDVQPVDLSEVVEAAADAVRPSAEAKGIRLRKVVDPLAGPVAGDPTRLQQVFWNLLTNAVKFTPKGGKVDLLVERVNSHVEVTVSDSGEGIAAEFLPHVFERFRQADASISRRHGGLGLGLSIVKQLAELHGGSVRVKSPGAGQGATFVVSLPLSPVRDRADREHPATPGGPPAGLGDVDLAGLKVLVVDDEPDARGLIRRVLTQRGAEVTTAGGAEEGLKLVKSLRPDVLVSDIGMPEKDGYRFLREVRALPAEEGGRTPAVALTAFARSEDRTRAMLAGYQVHVAKPIEPAELVATVASLAGRMTDA